MIDIHLFQFPDWFNHLTTALVFAGAMWRGDWRARLLGSLMLFTSLTSHWLCATWSCWTPTPQLARWSSLAADSLVLAAVLICARSADRYWVLWAGSFAVLAVVTDAIGLLADGLTTWAYGSALVIWNILLKGTIAWGVWEAAQARQPAGSPTVPRAQPAR